MSITFGSEPTTGPPSTDEPWVWVGDRWVPVATDTDDGVPPSLDDLDEPKAEAAMSGVTVRRAVPLKSVPDVELVAVGQWPARTGPITVTGDDLRQALAAVQCPAVGNPVLKLGHDEPEPDGRHMRWDGEPAVGWVSNLRLSPNKAKLLGDYRGVPGWLADVMPSAYPKRSVEIKKGWQCQIGHTHPFVITGVSLLGVNPPAVGVIRSLNDVQALYTIAAADGDPPPEVVRSIEVTLGSGITVTRSELTPIAVRVGPRVVFGTVALRFDPTEKRDRRGRWTEGGPGVNIPKPGRGGSSGETSDAELLRTKPWRHNRQTVYSDEAELTAWKLLQRYSEAESGVTPQLKDTAARSGGRMEGLDFRLKTQESLARKLEQKSQTKGLTVAQYGPKIGDALRYTMVAPPDRYGPAAQKTIDDFRREGWQVEVENSWPIEGGTYKGINTNIKKGGLTFELQFHTEESLRLKTDQHGLYETARDVTVSPQDRAAATARMIANTAGLSVPGGAGQVR